MKVLGLDLSIASTGWAIIEDGVLGVYGTAETPPTMPPMRRIDTILRVVRTALSANVDLVAIEGYSYASNTSLATSAQLGGCIRYWLWLRNIEYVEIPPGTWRKACFGDGRLKKDQVRVQALKRYGVEMKSIDALEAFCVAQCAYLQATGQAKPAIKRANPRRRRVDREIPQHSAA